MTGESGNINQLPPDEALALADALAERALTENALQWRIADELEGEPLAAPSEADRVQAKRGHMVMFLLKIYNPAGEADGTTGPHAPTASHMAIAEQLSKALGAPIAPEEIRDTSRHLANEMLHQSGVTKEETAAHFAKQVAAAREIATEQGITAAEVIADDALHAEVTRRMYTLVAFARLQARLLSGISESLFNKVRLERMGNKGLPPAAREQLHQAFLANPKAQAGIAAAAAYTQEIARQQFLHERITTWGTAADEALSPLLRALLTPQQPLVPAVLEALPPQKLV